MNLASNPRFFTLMDTVFPGLAAVAEGVRKLGYPWEDVTTPFVCSVENVPVSQVSVMTFQMAPEDTPADRSGLTGTRVPHTFMDDEDAVGGAGASLLMVRGPFPDESLGVILPFPYRC